ncbi:UNVERIFIED_CONTAM: Kinesin-like protein KIN-14F [Sesamum radiatum]|uniref:Kinesin-like protein KIN-14F n=1 Tax=Sesamum radiatum TaxID=300843 RepID=A0AAW2K3U2_SESRA
MPQESYSTSMFTSPSKSWRGENGLIRRSSEAPLAEEIINYGGLAQRKAEEAGNLQNTASLLVDEAADALNATTASQAANRRLAARRYQAAQWLRQMDHGASEAMPKEPTEEDFRLALRNGLILCNVLNKVKPGAIRKVVETPVLDVQATEGAALYAIQYFENVRNFLVAVGRMKLLTFEASDLEKGGSSSKVVDCILCLRGYYEWKQSGGIGVWKYGGTVRIMSSPRDPPSSVVSSESADESLDDFESSQYEQLLEFLHLYTDSHEDSRAANILTFMFDYFSLGLLQAYLTETNGFDELALSPMAIDMVVRKVVKDFSVLLASQGNQLGLFLKKVLNTDCAPQTKSQFLEAISKYLSKRMSLVSRDISNFCICGGKGQGTMHLNNSNGSVELLDLQRKQLEDLKALFRETKQEVHQIQLGWEKDFFGWANNIVMPLSGHHIKGLEVAASSFQKVLEENRVLFNQVQDMKGTIRVYCRVRPFLSGQSNGQSTVDYIGENGNIMIVNPQKQGKDARRVFSFNKVFGMNVTQYQIYAETQPLVRSVLDGYNVCIFAYGQTGSGKTYTMSGPNLTTEETWGVNYRALRDLFHISKARMDLIKYEVGVQMIEIYNEQVRDLLVTDGNIRNNSQLNGLNVPDASLIPVKCTEDVLDLMRVGQSNRAVGATALNERSSRSHSILTIHVRGKELVSGSILKGCLHLVDLAGSERVDRSEAVGGHAKTLMFVHINPEVNALGETISTLKFAERVATIDLGVAQSNKETSEIRDCKEEISNLKTILERKEAELEQLKSRTNVRGAASPLRMPKYNNASSKHEMNEKHVDTQNTEVSCGSAFHKQNLISFELNFRKINSSIKPRSPSPPVRRSTSTDRGTIVKTRIKSDGLENPPVIKAPFPSSVSVNKPVANLPATVPSTMNPRLNRGSQDPPFPDVLNSLHRVTIRKAHLGNEDEQFKQAEYSAIRTQKN